MNRKKILLTIVVAGMLLIAGCTDSTSSASREGRGPFIENGTHAQDPGDETVTNTIHYENGTTQEVTYNTEKIEQHLFERINEFRVENNAGKAGYSSSLASSASARSYHMIENDYFAHTSPGGIESRDFIDKTGECHGNIGENIAMTYGGEAGKPLTNRAVAQKIFEAWRTSPEGHRATMLTDGSSPSSIEMGLGIQITTWDKDTDYLEFYTTLHTCH